MQEKLITKPSIQEIIQMLGGETAKQRKRRVNYDGFISCRYGDSPIIRTHRALPSDKYDVLAWSVGRIVAYICYERRKRVYAYAIRIPMASCWEDIKAWEIPIDECFREIESMVADGYKGEIYKDAIMRRKKTLGTQLGTIEITEKDYAKYNREKRSWEFSEEGSTYEQKNYYVYDVKGDIRVYDSEVPKSNNEQYWPMNLLSKAISFEDEELAKEQIRIKLEKSKDSYIGAGDGRVTLAKMNLPDDVQSQIRAKVVLRGV